MIYFYLKESLVNIVTMSDNESEIEEYDSDNEFGNINKITNSFFNYRKLHAVLVIHVVNLYSPQMADDHVTKNSYLKILSILEEV